MLPTTGRGSALLGVLLVLCFGTSLQGLMAQVDVQLVLAYNFTHPIGALPASVSHMSCSLSNKRVNWRTSMVWSRSA